MLNELNDNNEDWNIHIQRKIEIKTEISIVIAKKPTREMTFIANFIFPFIGRLTLFIAEMDCGACVRAFVQSVCVL